jgi:hypothetical protein
MLSRAGAEATSGPDPAKAWRPTLYKYQWGVAGARDNGYADGIVAAARWKGKPRRGRCLRRSPGV